MPAHVATSPVLATKSNTQAQDIDAETIVTQPTKKGGDSDVDITDWITRGEVAAILRVSIATVRRMEGRDLHPRRMASGFYLFDPIEVETVRARRPPPPEPRECRDVGDLAAEAFKLLRDGVDVRDLVIALRRPASEVEALYADWERLGDMIVVSARTRLQLVRMIDHGLPISFQMLEAIESDDADCLRVLVTGAIESGDR
jgi:hypothetical protein